MDTQGVCFIHDNRGLAGSADEFTWFKPSHLLNSLQTIVIPARAVHMYAFPLTQYCCCSSVWAAIMSSRKSSAKKEMFTMFPFPQMACSDTTMLT